MENNNQRNDVRRRTFLKTTAAGLVAGSAVVGQVSGKRRRVWRASGTPAEPVTTAEVEQIQREANAEAGSDEEPSVLALPESDVVTKTGREDASALAATDVSARTAEETADSTPLVEYVYTVDDDGVSRSYVGKATEQTLDNVRQTAERKVGQFETASFGTDESVGTQQSLSWNVISQGQHDVPGYPYGVVTSNFDLFKLENDPNYRDTYAVKQTFAMEPGFRRWDTAQFNWRGFPRHNYAGYDFSNPELKDWDPLGTKNGSQSVSVALGASPALTWTYSQEATTYDESSAAQERAWWQQVYSFDNTQLYTTGMKPGSSVSVDPKSSGSGYSQLMELDARGRFLSGNTYFTHDVVSNWDLYVEY